MNFHFIISHSVGKARSGQDWDFSKMIISKCLQEAVQNSEKLPSLLSSIRCAIPLLKTLS